MFSSISFPVQKIGIMCINSIQILSKIIRSSDKTRELLEMYSLINCCKLLFKRHYSPILYTKQLSVPHLKGYVTYIKSAEKSKHNKEFEFKENVIQKLNFRNAKDSSGFYDLPVLTLLRILRNTQLDVNSGFCKNRLYYIADRIKIDSSILSKKICKRPFIYTMSFDWLVKSLHVLLEMGVPGEKILTDLWVLKYHHETIRERLQKVKSAGRDDLNPWMVRCPEEILERSIQISIDAKNILGDKASLQSYLANRLCASEEAIAKIVEKLPSIRTMRVTKAKKFLDLLLSEGYTEQDILDKPRIFTSSVKTVKTRLKKLKALNIKLVNLNVLCRCRRDFNKYYNTVSSYSAVVSE